MISSEIRQSFLDFFKSKQHTIVPSSSLMPNSPNLLFTNAGMNQFVPIFLGQTQCPYKPGRAADTQKCIRAGGKHNDLEDVGLDTYHHTFFEMLGNWSFGDYFKKEAIEWAWELVVEKWKFPPARLYATVYKPGPGEPSEFDQEAYDQWEKLFKAAGLDPKVHVCTGGKMDNFWMMGDTGPCGPCSELHMDLTPGGDTKGTLVNKGDARCIEIWNLVFIQFNANADGTFSPLPAKHVDTGMGFERVTSIIQCTKGFKDFANAKISNYETDIFRPIFDALEKLSGKKYGSTLPNSNSQPSTLNPQLSVDIAFRVIADHIRTLSFAIADGIQPSNEGRGYVLRRILRRAVRYGRTLGFHEPFFYKLVDVLADTMGDVFPEIRARKKHVQEVIQREEEAFNKTLDNGLKIFQQIIGEQMSWRAMAERAEKSIRQASLDKKNEFILIHKKYAAIPEALGVGDLRFSSPELRQAAFDLVGASTTTALFDASAQIQKLAYELSGSAAFVLSDTYGFPIDLTELMAREIGMSVDKVTFGILEEEQRARARAAQKKEVIQVDAFNFRSTKFVGYDVLETDCNLLGIIDKSNEPGQVPDFFAVTDVSALYAEMGGQVGDKGKLLWSSCGEWFDIIDTQKRGDVFFFKLHPNRPFELNQRGMLNIAISGEPGKLVVDKSRRNAIQRHHTVTHLLHWALHEVVNREASQKGSFVGPDKLTFDFNSAPLTPQQVADVEKLVNERIIENAAVSWTEVPYADVKSRKNVMQFFGEKYGDTVRVVQIGGHVAKLDGYSMELCGGTHTRATGEIGLFRIVGENAIAAGVRRIEAIAGLEAYRKATDELTLIKSLAGKVNSPVHELEKKIESLLEHQKAVEKQLRAAQQREASNAASNLLEQIQTVNGIPAIIHNLGGVDGDFLQAVADSLKERFKGVIVLGGGPQRGTVALVAAVTSDYIWKVQAGKIIQQIAPIVGGKGGGKPDNARGGGKDASKLDEALSRAKELLG
jgi:alanyl-tRNA synthetase